MRSLYTWNRPPLYMVGVDKTLMLCFDWEKKELGPHHRDYGILFDQIEYQ
jgi:hypothetical protein